MLSLSTRTRLKAQFRSSKQHLRPAWSRHESSKPSQLALRPAGLLRAREQTMHSLPASGCMMTTWCTSPGRAWRIQFTAEAGPAVRILLRNGVPVVLSGVDKQQSTKRLRVCRRGLRVLLQRLFVGQLDVLENDQSPRRRSVNLVDRQESKVGVDPQVAQGSNWAACG